MTRATLAIATAIVMGSSFHEMAAGATSDYSERLDALWDYRKPAVSLQRFEKEAKRHAADSRERNEALTQVARAKGLLREFDAADATLDRVEAAVSRLPARVRVRYMLERGRVQNSSGHPATAVALFDQALAATVSDSLPGAQFYRVDAMHMLGIAAPKSAQLEWDLRALAEADASNNARVRRWIASLCNNIGWYYHDRGDYPQALGYFERALPAWEARGNQADVRFAKWSIARTLRSLGRIDEALAMQQALLHETERAGEPDGYVYEEIGELDLLRGDAAASAWFAKAYALLKDDPELAASEPARLARMRTLAHATPGSRP